jgi:hypothetical protein
LVQCSTVSTLSLIMVSGSITLSGYSSHLIITCVDNQVVVVP